MSTLTIKSDKPMVLISFEEYDSMKETIEILKDPDLVRSLKQGLKDVAEGKTRKLSEIRREHSKK